jgi:hypothetical protein
LACRPERTTGRPTAKRRSAEAEPLRGHNADRAVALLGNRRRGGADDEVRSGRGQDAQRRQALRRHGRAGGDHPVTPGGKGARAKALPRRAASWPLARHRAKGPSGRPVPTCVPGLCPRGASRSESRPTYSTETGARREVGRTARRTSSKTQTASHQLRFRSPQEEEAEAPVLAAWVQDRTSTDAFSGGPAREVDNSRVRCAISVSPGESDTRAMRARSPRGSLGWDGNLGPIGSTDPRLASVLLAMLPSVRTALLLRPADRGMQNCDTKGLLPTMRHRSYDHRAMWRDNVSQ